MIDVGFVFISRFSLRDYIEIVRKGDAFPFGLVLDRCFKTGYKKMN